MKKSFLLAVLLASMQNANALSKQPDQSPIFGPNIGYKVTKTEAQNIFVVRYSDRTVFQNCSSRTPELVIMKVNKGSAKVSDYQKSLYFVKALPRQCQVSTKVFNEISYQEMFVDGFGAPYSFGQLIPSEIAVGSGDTGNSKDIAGFHTTNNFPAENGFRRGPWQAFAKYLQCVRAQTDFTYIAGTVGSTDPIEAEQLIAEGFGIQPPEFVYGSLIFKNGSSQTFIFSNRKTSSGTMNDQLVQYIYSLEKIEQIIGKKLPLPEKTNQSYVNYKLLINSNIRECDDIARTQSSL